MQYTGRQAEGFQIMSKQKRALQRRFDDSLSVFLFFPPPLAKVGVCEAETASSLLYLFTLMCLFFLCVSLDSG